MRLGKGKESINSDGQEIQMRTLGENRKKKTKRAYKEGVDMVKILEKPPPSADLQGTFQFYDDSFPPLLENLITAEQWDEIMTKVNSLWRPIHEESVALQIAKSWWDYTMVGAYRRHNRQKKLSEQVLNAAAQISAYFKQVNDRGMGFRLRVVRTNVARPDEEEDFVYPVHHIEVRIKPEDQENEAIASSADHW